MEPHVEVEITQQTPKPAAQFPSALPPLLVHSLEVKQVPLMLESEKAVQALLPNCTMEKRENCPEDCNI